MRRPLQENFFGAPAPAQPQSQQIPPRPAGYAARPGTGPEGETCASCVHCRTRMFKNGKQTHKCGLMRAGWTFDRSTDVLMKSPACSKWETGKTDPPS